MGHEGNGRPNRGSRAQQIRDLRRFKAWLFHLPRDQLLQFALSKVRPDFDINCPAVKQLARDILAQGNSRNRVVVACNNTASSNTNSSSGSSSENVASTSQSNPTNNVPSTEGNSQINSSSESEMSKNQNKDGDDDNTEEN